MSLNLAKFFLEVACYRSVLRGKLNCTNIFRAQAKISGQQMIKMPFPVVDTITTCVQYLSHWVFTGIGAPLAPTSVAVERSIHSSCLMLLPASSLLIFVFLWLTWWVTNGGLFPWSPAIYGSAHLLVRLTRAIQACLQKLNILKTIIWHIQLIISFARNTKL